MRKLKTNSQDDFRVKAYAGTNGVLLAFDLAASRRQGLLGFAIQQKEGTQKWQWLLNSLTFPDRAHTLPKWNATPSNIAPIQKFRWADYSIEANTTCRYRVHLVYGKPDAPELGESLDVAVTTDDGKPKDHRVIFNRAVAASQSFGRQFPELDALLSAEKEMPIEDWPAKPRNWLQHGLLDQILAFIERAKNGKWALDIAIYEYELKAIVDAVNAAHKRGVQVRVLYHAKAGDGQTGQNEASLKKIPAARKRGRQTKNIFHDKFVVLSKINAAGGRVPQAVLCGSTNFTENGVYRQANVVHVADDKSIAARYLQLFGVIWDDPADVAATRKWIGTNNPIDPTQALFAGFSPRPGGADLAEFINVINAADKDLLFATAFRLPEAILDALLGTENDDVLRYGIQNTASRITGFHADRTAEFAATALLSKGLEGWVKEGLKGQRGNLLVHLKAIVANFTTDAPVVISGSHNFSTAASNGNDENYLIIRGDTDLADRYGLEILRFYEHYRFRYYAKLLKLKQVRPLAIDDSWADAYYQNGSLKALSRLRFSGR
ncbi:phospholipase D-like domain-containing protein [Thiobacillus sp.]|uniref:phospholipase D-like domain-containing protein n=1 Tax=Thiobacillus sp. TaxID=924 RepID=UPI0017C422EA|nr:phospholipase D-like domain-containing protein [Thiobacillus sp.]MBC2729767.1 phospholipase [Thiobacillus sp.]MBC2738502.1 phospholipase [Thiobacillus sp.]MBC2761218.1 phospholipase [Thiobacillus sp.]